MLSRPATSAEERLKVPVSLQVSPNTRDAVCTLLSATCSGVLPAATRAGMHRPKKEERLSLPPARGFYLLLLLDKELRDPQPGRFSLASFLPGAIAALPPALILPHALAR